MLHLEMHFGMQCSSQLQDPCSAVGFTCTAPCCATLHGLAGLAGEVLYCSACCMLSSFAWNHLQLAIWSCDVLHCVTQSS